MFQKVNMLLVSREKISKKIKGTFKRLSALQNIFERYFPEAINEDLDFVRNPFAYPVEKLSDECQDEFLEMINDSTARQDY